MQRFFVVMAAAATIASTAVLSGDAARDVAQYTFAVANAPKDIFSSDGRLRLRPAVVVGR